MNKHQISNFVHRYLAATECKIIEKSPSFVTVKLSPEADRALTGRDYYWNFVERTGVEPETMTFTFVFDPAAVEQPNQPKVAQADRNNSATAASDSILGRYFGFTPTPVSYGVNATRKELLHYGSRRLDQIFQTVNQQGRFVHMYEAPIQNANQTIGSHAYSTWLGINYKVEFVCDMKREELHSLGISLSTGELVTDFQSKLERLTLTPRLPANAHLRQTISLQRAAVELEQYLQQNISSRDHRWAQEAQNRLMEELQRIDQFYHNLRDGAADEAEKNAIWEQYLQRKSEMKWQHKPRIQISAINCGCFHLWRDTFSDYDESR